MINQLSMQNQCSVLPKTQKKINLLIKETEMAYIKSNKNFIISFAIFIFANIIMDKVSFIGVILPTLITLVSKMIYWVLYSRTIRNRELKKEDVKANKRGEYINLKYSKEDLISVADGEVCIYLLLTLITYINVLIYCTVTEDFLSPSDAIQLCSLFGVCAFVELIFGDNIEKGWLYIKSEIVNINKNNQKDFCKGVIYIITIFTLGAYSLYDNYWIIIQVVYKYNLIHLMMSICAISVLKGLRCVEKAI